MHSCCPAPQTFAARSQQSLCGARGWEEQRTVKGKGVNLEPSALPEELSGFTKSPAVFPIIMQLMPANDGGHEYDEITWHPIEILDSKWFKESIDSYRMHSPFIKQY